MKRSTIIYLFLITTAVALFGWGLWRAYRAFKASMVPTAYACVISPLSSEQAALSLKDLLGRAILEKGGSFVYTAKLVQQNFPHCTSISCRQQPSGLVQARIDLDEPFCAVNDDMIMTTRGVVVLRTLYADDALAGLPQLRLENQKDSSVSPYLLSFLKHVPDSLLSTHEIVYRSDDEIALVRRDMSQRENAQRDISQSSYLCAVDTVIDQELLMRCDNVMADYEQQKTTSKKKARTALVLDLRFDKQVILYPHMGGQIHG